MKATFKLPKTNKGWFSLGLVLFAIFLGGWPIIPLLNHETILFGMPILMTWSIVLIFLVTFTMWFINKIGGVEE